MPSQLEDLIDTEQKCLISPFEDMVFCHGITLTSPNDSLGLPGKETHQPLSPHEMAYKQAFYFWKEGRRRILPVLFISTFSNFVPTRRQYPQAYE